MTSDAPYTYYGSVVTVGPTDVDVSDDAIEFTLEAESKVATVEVYGSAQARSAGGALTWSGNLQVVYDHKGSPSTGYNLLMAELLSRTKGGYKIVLKPAEGSGEEIITIAAILSGRKQQGSKASDIQAFQFPFTVNGQPDFDDQA